MKPASLSQLKQELNNRPPDELFGLLLRLARFKKENKELLTYLLFEADDEDAFVKTIKADIDREFDEINTGHIYYAKKSIRKILRSLNKFIRFSGKKETEVELRLHFCAHLLRHQAWLRSSAVLRNMLQNQKQSIHKAILKLHEDLQFDYKNMLDEIFRSPGNDDFSR